MSSKTKSELEKAELRCMQAKAKRLEAEAEMVKLELRRMKKGKNGI